jgi:SagB-type dehydrogenase family enzyme
MRSHRRRFLQLVRDAAAVLVAGGLPACDAEARVRGSVRDAVRTALDLHRDTRNTVLGDFGARWRGLTGTPPGRSKPYPGLPRVALEEPAGGEEAALAETLGASAPPPRFRGRPLPHASLAQLLDLANGVTGRAQGRGGETVLLRAAPSAGALYAGELYVVAERVEGLEAGIYSFHVPSHELVRLRPEAALDRVAEALEAPALAEGAAAAILATNVFHRYGWRYGERGYRYALIDTGHIGENLRIAAAAGALGWVSPARFEDARLHALLGLDGIEEAVCAVHLVGPDAEAREAPPVPGRRLVEARETEAFVPGGFESPAARFHAATSLVPADEGEETGRAGDAQDELRAGSLVAPELRARPARFAIRSRRSPMAFLPRSLERARLEAVLDACRGRLLAPGPDEPGSLGVLVVAHRVEELEAGVHRFDPRTGRLVTTRRGPLADAFVRACLSQRMAGTAAAGVLMTVRLPAAVMRGARGYRDILVRAGAVGQDIYLAAVVLGLAARNLAAFLDDPLNELVGLDGEREAVVHLTMVGQGG